MNNVNRYDANSKRILYNKDLISYIMVTCIPEYKGISLKEAKECIISDSDGDFIECKDTVNEDSTNSKIIYDVLFTTRVPNSNSEIDMYINIEAQNYYYPGYDLGNRAECYTSSLLMRQLNTLPSENKYDNLKKVYSIWICTSPPKKLKNKIILYKFHGEELTSLDCSKENKIYSNSLQNIIMIYLSNVYKEDKDKNNIINLLSLLFGELNFNKKEIINHLKNDYDIITLNKEAIDMCSLGEGIERRALDKGIQQGMQQGIQIGKYEYSINLINIGVPKEVIFEALRDEPDVIKKIKAALSNKN